MAVLRSRDPYWFEHKPKRVPRYPKLRDDLAVDVAIVGGGIAGATIAYVLAAEGFSVALLEALRVGAGSTAASTALLMQEPDEDLMKLAARYGSVRAQRIWELSRDASDGFIGLIKRLRIPCEYEDRDSVYFTLDQQARLYREHQLRRRTGLGGRWMAPAALHRATGIQSGSGIRTAGNAQVNPYNVCLGLVEKAVAKGVHVFEQTRATHVKRAGGEMSIKTAHGHIHASTVVIATGYATPEFRPLLARFRMRHTYVLVTERLSSRMRARLGLSDLMLWDTDRPYHYARWTNDHRLMLGGGDRPRVRGAKRRHAFRLGTSAVRDFFVRMYPALESVGIDYAWEGLFATTPDGLPYIGPHRRYPGHLFALGYGGNGMTLSYLAARLILERLKGRSTNDHELFGFGRMK